MLYGVGSNQEWVSKIWVKYMVLLETVMTTTERERMLLGRT